MGPSQSPWSPDDFELAVDDERFHVVYDATQPGAYHYTWLTGPAPGYGFTSQSSSLDRRAVEHHLEAIRTFLKMVDPTTGYIEDDPADQGG